MATEPVAGTIRQEGVFASGLNLGGMGTGGVELWPDGRFYHWSMMNCRPWANAQKHPHGKAKKGEIHHTIDPVEPSVGDHDFLVRIQEKGKRPVYRWLFTGHGNMIAAGHFFRHHKWFFIKSFKAIEYRAEYPFIHLTYVDDELPINLRLRAWTSFVPHDEKNSSLPGCYFDFSVTNRTGQPIDVSLVWQQQNFGGYAAKKVTQRQTKLRAHGAHMVRMEGSLDEPGHDTSGCMTLWAKPRKGQKVTVVAANPYLPNLIWPIHLTGGLMGPLFPDHISREEISNPPGATPNKGWLCVQDRIAPRQQTEINMGMAWFYPNHRSILGTRVGHVYETWFSDSVEVAKYHVRNRDKLLAGSQWMPELLMGSSLPDKLRLSLLDQLNTLSKSTHFIKNGRFGLQEGHGCCAFNTMDVDHYSSYALALLFPRIREQVMDQQTKLAHPESGKIHHGLPATVEDIDIRKHPGYNRWDNCCQYVLQAYRDTKWSGNIEALKRYWPTARRAMDVIIGLDFYDIGLPYIEGGITYDHWRMKGVVTFMAGLHLAALLAMEDMAKLLGEPETATRMHKLFEDGCASFERFLWNGEQYLLYYSRQPRGEAKGYVYGGEEGHDTAQRPPECCTREGAYIEIGDTGIMTDVINGNGTAEVMGLGTFLDPVRVREQLQLILDRNTQEENAAVINGSYPDGHFLDGWPFMQWQTPWTGTEYFLALQLYEAGMVKQGDHVIDLVYDRHVREGMRFDQSECNNHYSRPLCLWGAYVSRLGLKYDGFRRELRIKPAGRERAYDGLMMTAVAGGRLAYVAGKAQTTMELSVETGKMPVRSLVVGASVKTTEVRLQINSKAIAASVEYRRGEAAVSFSRQQTLKAGDRLTLVVK